MSDTTQTVETVAFPTAAEYAAADKGEKARIRAFVTNAQKDAMRAGDATRAFAAFNALESYVSETPKKSEIDYIGLVAQKVANLRAAADMLESGNIRPTGVPTDTDLSGVRARVNGDLMATTPVAPTSADTDTATAIASVSVARSTKSNKWDDVIVNYFADKESGHFASCATIANTVNGSAGAAMAASDRFTEPVSGVVFQPAVEGVTPNGYRKV